MDNKSVRAPKASAKFADFKVQWDRLWMRAFGHHLDKDLDSTPMQGFEDDRRTDLAVTIQTLTTTLQKAQEERKTTEEFRKRIVNESNKIFEALKANNPISKTKYRTVGDLRMASNNLGTKYRSAPRALHPESSPEMTEFSKCVDQVVAELIKEPTD